MTKSAALVDTYAQYPVEFVSGSGSRLRGSDGREYWDFYGGHAVAVLGHSHPAVTRAVTEQAATLTFYSNVTRLGIRTRAAERLCRFAGAGLEHVFFCNSGAEANENALKLALQQTGRTRIAALAGGWHGRTVLCLSATDDPPLTTPMRPFLCDGVRLRPNVIEDIGRIDASVAAIILEPIQSIAGIVEIRGDFLHALRQRCDDVGALLIYDEVQTGMGRLGRPLAAGAFAVSPDMATLAKGIANGIPMGAVLMNARVGSRVKPGDLGSTFGGGPVACAAMLAVVDEIESGGLVSRAAALGEQMRSRLGVGPVKQVRGRGCLIGLQMEKDVKPLQGQLLSRGFVTGTSHDKSVLRLMPPINLPDEAIEELAAALREMGG